MEVRVCRSCGVEKSIEEFRHYYGGRKGHFRLCKQCESIDTRRKYLMRKGSLTTAEQQDLNNILELYSRRAAKGLRPPTHGTKNGQVSALVSSLLDNE